MATKKKSIEVRKRKPKPVIQPDQYKILRGLRDRVATVKCKSVFRPSDPIQKEQRDIIECSINVADNKNENWEKHRKKLKSASVEQVVNFRIDVQTDPALAIEVRNLCNSDHVKCENVLPKGYMKEFLDLLPKTMVVQSGVSQKPIYIEEQPTFASVPQVTSSKPVIFQPPTPPSTFGKGKEGEEPKLQPHIKEMKESFIEYRDVDSFEACAKKKNPQEEIEPIWLEYTNIRGMKVGKCIPIIKGFIPSKFRINDRELCQKLKESPDTLLQPFNIEWKEIFKEKESLIPPNSRYDPATEVLFNKEYVDVMAETNVNKKQALLKTLEDKFKPLRLQPKKVKTKEKINEICEITRKDGKKPESEPEKSKEPVIPPNPPQQSIVSPSLPPPPPSFTGSKPPLAPPPSLSVSGQSLSQPPATLKPPPPPPQTKKE